MNLDFEIDNIRFNARASAIIYNKDIKKYDIIDDCIIVKDEKMLKKFYSDECIRVFSNELRKYEKEFNRKNNRMFNFYYFSFISKLF